MANITYYDADGNEVSGDDWLAALQVQMFKLAENQIVENLEQHTCSVHHKHPKVMAIHMTKKDTMTFDINYCCKDFEKQCLEAGIN